jgi:AcrR family transcriptional regulator
MVDEKESTKEKILNTAHKLFADHGFDGASIRDIATAAEVNVASINYYFNSKENLFQQSLVLCYEKTQHLIEEAVQRQEVRTTQDLAIKIFR